IDYLFPSLRGVGDDELIAQLGPDYAIENRHGLLWFLYRPTRAQTQRPPGGTGPHVYRALTGGGMVTGLRETIADRQAQIAAELRERSGGAVDPVALRAAYDRDPQLQSLRDALASWTTDPHSTDTPTILTRTGTEDRAPAAYIDLDPNTGISWASSTLCALTPDGERSCVSVAVITSGSKCR
ncbi:hypothetical protein, partial [Actinoallomurus soli]|uniref:hypothetical protein n=1 Tax=Actinoallomurus soli TaxID=2952535 RepID=UPI002092B5B9